MDFLKDLRDSGELDDTNSVHCDVLNLFHSCDQKGAPFSCTNLQLKRLLYSMWVN